MAAYYSITLPAESDFTATASFLASQGREGRPPRLLQTPGILGRRGEEREADRQTTVQTQVGAPSGEADYRCAEKCFRRRLQDVLSSLGTNKGPVETAVTSSNTTMFSPPDVVSHVNGTRAQPADEKVRLIYGG